MNRIFAELQCTCGSTDLFSIQPGQDPVREGPTNVLLDAGAPTIAMCRICAMRKFRGLKEAKT